ncbi:MAG: hypothetical protein AAGJ50_04465 [Pseudomonadota bacterium]
MTRSDLLLSFSEGEYTATPYQLLLSVMGCDIEEEPWGRSVSDHVWQLDFECIEDKKSYVTIVKKLCKLAKVESKLNGVLGDVDFETNSATLTYKLGDRVRNLTPKFDGDWLDEATLKVIVSDIENAAGKGRHFWVVDNGQAAVFLFVRDETAKALNTLKRRLVSRFT